MFNVPRHVKSPEEPRSLRVSDGITAPLLQRSSMKPQRRMDEVVVTKGHVVEAAAAATEEGTKLLRVLELDAAQLQLLVSCQRLVVHRSVHTFIGALVHKREERAHG